MLLNNKWITEEIKEKIKKYLGTNDNENTMIQNLWNAEKEVIRGKFIAIQCYLRKQEKFSNIRPNLTPKGMRKNKQNTKLEDGKKL